MTRDVLERRFVVLAMLAPLALATFVVGCGGGDSGLVKTATAPGGSKDPSHWPSDDRSMCDWRNKSDVEVAETMGPGALKANVRRVFKMVGEGDSRHRTLACREVDTNLDGIKDVVRTFNQKGEALHEEADTDYDGKVDHWLNFVDGRLAQEDVDTNKDGKADVWKFYVNGQLQRIRRDRSGDGKPDVWEMYSKGRLDRIGVDENADGHVDRWDRDEQLKYEADANDRKAREQSEGDAGASTSNDATQQGHADAGPAAKSAASAAKKK